MTGIEPVTSSLPRKCSTPELHGRKTPSNNGQTPNSRHIPGQCLSLPTGSAPFKKLERVGGIEPPCSAWKADVLPLNYTRQFFRILHLIHEGMVEGEGFEPSKAEPADLQSAPFGHSGTPPVSNRAKKGYTLSGKKSRVFLHGSQIFFFSACQYGHKADTDDIARITVSMADISLKTGSITLF